MYNFHGQTTPWLNGYARNAKISHIPHVIIHHDMHQALVDTFQPSKCNGFNYVVAMDNTLVGNKNVFTVNRLIPPATAMQYRVGPVPVIGFQGFGPPRKGISRIAHTVQNEFDEAIIRLHIPFSFYGDPHGKEAYKIVLEVRSIITKPGIKIEATHDLMATQQIVDWLSQNTINCYFYDQLPGAGLASSPDNALAARRPIAVTKSHQLRNFLG